MDLDNPFEQDLALPGPSDSGNSVDQIDDPFTTKRAAKKNNAVPKQASTSSAKPAMPAPKTAPHERPPVPAPSPIPPSPASGLTQARAKEIYQEYLAARKKCNQRTDNIAFRDVAKSLSQTYVATKGAVEFKVVIEEGKAILISRKKR